MEREKLEEEEKGGSPGEREEVFPILL